MTEKAKEYAKAAREKIESGAVEIEGEIAKAFEVGYRLGLTDAHRKEYREEPQINFDRGLT